MTASAGEPGPHSPAGGPAAASHLGPTGAPASGDPAAAPASAPEDLTGTGIEVRGLRRAFGSVVAVDDVSLTARPGEVTGLVGPNGAGKTTLMLVLATLLTPDRGTMRIEGLDPVRDTREVRRRVGWMPDGFGTWDALTVREVLAFVCAAYEMTPATARERTDEVLDLLHLGDLADRRARVLSRGQRQRLGLARALVHHPSVLLLDEPASGLDPRSRIELRDVVRGLAARGCTVLVSSHILTELEEMADRSVVVEGGRCDGRQIASGATGRGGTWRVRALDGDALARALTTRRVPHRPGHGVVDVDLPGERAAADLLAALAADGVPVVEFAPATSALESAYLAATKDRR